MPAQIDIRDEALRCAREAAHVVLAKHSCVTGGAGKPSETGLGALDCDRILAAYERQDVGRGQDAAGASGPQ